MGIGIPPDPEPESYFNRYNAPNRVHAVESRSRSINSYECLAVTREDLKKQKRETKQEVI
jgi:hypothetical protein